MMTVFFYRESETEEFYSADIEFIPRKGEQVDLWITLNNQRMNIVGEVTKVYHMITESKTGTAVNYHGVYLSISTERTFP